MVSTSVYDEVAEFIAKMNPSNVIEFKPSADNQNRFDFLLEKHKETDLSNEEKSELEQLLILNRIIGLAKARAVNLLAK